MAPLLYRKYMSVRCATLEPQLAKWTKGGLQSTRQEDSASCGPFVLLVHWSSAIQEVDNLKKNMNMYDTLYFYTAWDGECRVTVQEVHLLLWEEFSVRFRLQYFLVARYAPAFPTGFYLN